MNCHRRSVQGTLFGFFFSDHASSLEDGVAAWLENSMNRPCDNLDTQTKER